MPRSLLNQQDLNQTNKISTDNRGTAWFVVWAANRFLRQRPTGVNRALQVVVTGEKLTVGTGDAVHLLGTGDRVLQSAPDAPACQGNNCPGGDKANRHKIGLDYPDDGL